jgi:hypothetical protein
MKTHASLSTSFRVPGARRLRAAGLLFMILAALALAPSADAFEPTISKLHARNSTAVDTPAFGIAVAISAQWILVGEIDFDSFTPPPPSGGAVYVYNAVTRAFVRKLTAGADAHAGDLFGSSVAVSGNLALVGAEVGDGVGVNSGCAYVFNLLTGALVAKLQANPGEGASGDAFGSTVALSGNVALVGAPNSDQASPSVSNCGAAYIFNATTGAQLFKLTAGGTEAHLGDSFGFDVALNGHLALIGASSGDGAVVNSGTAYLFHVVTGGLLLELSTPPGAEASDDIGTSVAMSGNLALVGARLGDGAVGNSGVAHVFNTATGTYLRTLQAPDGVANDNFGSSVALDGYLALVSSTGDDDIGSGSGSAWLFDVRTGTALRKLTAPDGAASDFFGRAVDLCGGIAVIGAEWDDDLRVDSGAVYVFQPVAGPFPLARVAAVKDFGSGLPETSFLSFGHAFLNSSERVIFPAALTGTGAAGGRNLGLWDTLAANSSLDLVLRGLDDVSAAVGFPPGNIRLSAAPSFTPLLNNQSFAIFAATLSGTGVTTANNRAIFGDTGTTVNKLLRTGTDTPLGGGATVSRFLQVVQSNDAAGRQAVAFQLRPKSTVPAVTASNDTGILVLDNAGTPVDFVREDVAPVPALGDGARFGQFARVGFGQSDAVPGANDTVFTVALQNSIPAKNQALFRHAPIGAETPVKRKGDPAVDGLGDAITDVFYSAFLGETIIPEENSAVFRATLSGAGVTTANNEGLWGEDLITPEPGTALRLIARKGDLVPAVLGRTDLGGVRWDRFLNFWGVAHGQGQVIFLAKMRGTGVTTGNDLALWLCDEFSGYILLLREGDLAPGCGAARIGAIQRVVASDGPYAILATLVNTSSTTNQVLLAGRTTRTNSAQRRPFMVLRKGTLYDPGIGGPARLLSLSLPASAFDATGAGGKGLGQPINESGSLLLKAQFSDGTVQLVKGSP